jgi:hypothetical protein
VLESSPMSLKNEDYDSPDEFPIALHQRLRARQDDSGLVLFDV